MCATVHVAVPRALGLPNDSDMIAGWRRHYSIGNSRIRSKVEDKMIAGWFADFMYHSASTLVNATNMIDNTEGTEKMLTGK